MHSAYVSEWKIFKILDNMRPTATGLGELPAWFLRVGAPVFCAGTYCRVVQLVSYCVVRPTAMETS